MKGKNLILLIHGFTKANETVSLLDFHYHMTPNDTVLMVDWRKDINNYYKWYLFFMYLRNYYKAAHFAANFEMNDFLNNFQSKTISCIGHSLGSHMCGSICRNFSTFSGKNCSRIVGLDVASMGFWKKGELSHKRLSISDANYVAAIMTTKFYGMKESAIAHDYITANIDGDHIVECPEEGKYNATVCGTNIALERYCVDFSIGTGESASCAHTMPVLIFAKSLDVEVGLSVVSLEKYSYHRLISGWNGYTMSVDRRSKGVFPNWISTNETGFIPKSMLLVKVKENYSSVYCRGFNRFEKVGGGINEWVSFHNFPMMDRTIECNGVAVEYARMSLLKTRYIEGYKFIEIFKDTKNCSVTSNSSTCYLERGVDYTIVPRETFVSKLNSECREFKPFSHYRKSSNFTLFTSVYKQSHVRLEHGFEYILVDGKIKFVKGRFCSKHGIEIKGDKLNIMFKRRGIYKVSIIYPYKEINYTVLVGSTVLIKGPEIIKSHFPVYLYSSVRTCKNATWYKNGEFVRIGCQLAVYSSGYYRVKIDYGKGYELIEDFAVNL